MNRLLLVSRLGCVALCSVLTAPASGQGTWQSSLLARDFGNDGTIDAYYDTVLDITWLADANYAKTSGESPTYGTMWFTGANDWAAGLTLFGGSDWRMPTLSPVNGSTFNYDYEVDGSSDNGKANTGVGWGEASELGYMYYVHLGNDGTMDLNTGPFENMRWGYYWTDTAHNRSDVDWAWAFNFRTGEQLLVGQFFNAYAWPVHPGDLIGSGVPGPACRADVNGDGMLDLFDILGFFDTFGAADPAADINGDGTLDLFDLLGFFDIFGDGC